MHSLGILIGGIGDDALGEHVVFERFASHLVLSIAEPGVLGQAHHALGGVVVDVIGMAVGDLAGLLDALLELGRLAVGHRLGQEFLGEVDLRLVRRELAALHGNFYIAAEDPQAVVHVAAERFARRLALIRGDRIGTLRDPHLAKEDVVGAQVELRGLRIQIDRPGGRRGRKHGRGPRDPCAGEREQGGEGLELKVGSDH